VKELKEGIHPKYYQTVIKCACGATYETGSTKEKINVEIVQTAILSSQESRSL